MTPADYVPPPEKPVVVICDKWDADETVLPRLESLGADVDKVGKFTQVHTSDLLCGSKDFRKTSFPIDCAMFAYILRQHPRCRLIVIDNLENYCESPRQLREAIKELDEAAMAHQVTILATIQSNVRITKEGAICDTARKNDGLARSIWCITPDPSRPGLMRMEPRRMAFCKKPAGMAFRINEPGKIDWEPLPPYERPPTDAAKRKKLKHTRLLTWLAATLGTGVVPAKVIYDAGAEQGFSKAKLIEAREEMGARTFKERFGKSGVWLWTRKPTHEVTPTEICDALSKELNDEGDAVRRAAVSNATQSVPTGVPTQSVGTRNFRALNENRPKKNGNGPYHKNGNGEKHPPLYDPEVIRILAQRVVNEILSGSMRNGEKRDFGGGNSDIGFL